jgi:hypothetical protein
MSGRFRELDEALESTRADVREGLEGVTARYHNEQCALFRVHPAMGE